MKPVLVSIMLIVATVGNATDPSAETLAILRQPSREATEAYQAYVEKYAYKTPVGEAAMADSRAKWSIFSRYAKALWNVYDCIEPGDSMFKYPGLLSHGTIRWDEEKQQYRLGLGLHPFSPGDGLGAASIAFDLNGKALSKSKAKYPW